MWEKLAEIKKWVIEQVVWAEREMKGRSGKEKKAIVVSKIDDIIKLPWWLEWADGPLISWLVDLACEKLNWLTDRDFGGLWDSEGRSEKLAAVMEAPLSAIKSVGGGEKKSVDEKLEELYKQYGIKPDVATPKPEAPREEKEEPSDDFKRAISFSLKWEGGRNFDIVDGKPVIKGKNTTDKGGATAFGITMPTLKYAHASGVVGHDDIVKLTRAEAEAIYKRNYWERYGWGELPWPVSLCCLDISINHGGFAWIIQRAIWNLQSVIAIDGKYGPQTRKALFELAQKMPEALAAEICRERKLYYDKIISKDGKQDVFRMGWYRRVHDLAKTAGVKSPVE